MEWKPCSLELKAQKLSGLDNWYAWDFQAIDGGVICKGGVCPMITKGPNKGTPNYRKAEPSTIKTVFVPREKN